MNALEFELALQIRAEAEAAGYGGKEAVYQNACENYGLSRATLMRRLREVTVTWQARKRRSDAGKVRLAHEQAKLLSAVLMEEYRANKKKIMSTKLALQTLRAHQPDFASWTDPQTGEIRLLSESACNRALRHYKLHPEQLNAPAPAQQQRSLHPNDVWMIDASISTLFYVPDEGVADMSPAEFYKNKPENFERIKRQRLTRYVITDHYSGAIFLHYVAGGESIVNMAEAFLRAIDKRVDNPFHGVPFHLVIDPGSAGASGSFGNLMKRLQIELVVNAAGNPRAKGQVENAHNLVETNFECGFKLREMRSIEQINECAAVWMNYYNATQKHTRHGMSRFSKWLEIKPGQLRTVDAELARNLLTHAPATPRVNDFLQVSFAGRVWDVRGVPNVIVGEKVEVTYNPFNKAAAYVISHDQQGNELLVEVPQVQTDENSGFALDASLIGREYKRPADTPADTNRKLVQRVAMQAATDEEAEQKRKAKALPFGGKINPYKHMEDMPMPLYVPRQSEVVQPAVTVAGITAAPRLLNQFEAIRELRLLGMEPSAERNALLRRLYPDGVPEDQLQSLKARLEFGSMRVIAGGKD